VKSREIGQKQVRTRRVAFGGKQQAKSSAGKPGDFSLDALSGYALIERLRGSYKGKTSLVMAREREHKRDERTKNQKLGVRDR
jgi:hypothetical protein